MGDTFLPIVYLLFLVILLGGASLFIFRQILSTRRIESNLAQLQRKLKQEKGTAQEYYELGSILLNKKLYSQAIGHFQQALKVKDVTDEIKALTFNALGFAYFCQGQHDLAIRQYKDALKIQPGYVVAMNNLANAYESKQLTSQALETYEQTLDLDPGNATAKRRVESLRKRLGVAA